MYKNTSISKCRNVLVNGVFFSTTYINYLGILEIDYLEEVIVKIADNKRSILKIK